MTREQIELKYDEFFGKGYWEEQYKKHIVEFAFQCSNGGKPLVRLSLPQDESPIELIERRFVTADGFIVWSDQFKGLLTNLLGGNAT